MHCECKTTIDNNIDIDERIRTAREHKEFAIKLEIERGFTDKIAVVAKGYDDLISSLINRRETIQAQKSKKGIYRS
jgi:hypothetical protein